MTGPQTDEEWIERGALVWMQTLMASNGTAALTPAELFTRMRQSGELISRQQCEDAVHRARTRPPGGVL